MGNCFSSLIKKSTVFFKAGPSSKYLMQKKEIHCQLDTDRKEFLERWENPLPANAQLSDFDRIRTLGRGSFGRVMLVFHYENKKYYAMKIMDKLKVLKKRQIEHTLSEKRILAALHFKFAVNLVYHFKDNSNLYLVMYYVMGGELFSRIRDFKRFSEKEAKFYSSQVVLALQYLHSIDIVHRDIKPENVLLAKDGYLKITDFGFAKRTDGRMWTLLGTPCFIAPEIILSKGYNKSVDWWSFGVLLFEMVAGFPPFYNNDQSKLYEQIVSCSYTLPHFFSPVLKNLIKHLLQVDLTRRYGNLKNRVDDIAAHKWFEQLDWLGVYHKSVKAPYIPEIEGPGDDKYFNLYNEPPLLIAMSEQCPEEFQDF